MKRGFYLRLAMDGMRKNRQLYLPYLLTCAGAVTVFYILSALSRSPLLDTVRSGGNMRAILTLGTYVIALFSLLFLLYTNSFLIRRRNREFGLYNILGMNKRNLSRILLWETLLSALLSLAAGLACGLLLSKLAELALLRMAGEAADDALRLDPGSLLIALGFFGLIFALLLLVSLARVGVSKPLDLLRSEVRGEKPPRANWVPAAAGLIILGGAYWLSLRIEEPMTALLLFFAAVLMVILATYLLFLSGSVALCRLLQKNKRYYYRSAHFVSVSSMAFRMKRNGAGLASICVLATMVLVMLSSTGCLYFGGENAIRGLCPYDLRFVFRYDRPEDWTPEAAEQLQASVHEAAGGRERGMVSYTVTDISGYFADGSLDVDGYTRFLDLASSPSALEHVRNVYLLPLSAYERLTGDSRALAPGEALIWSSGEPYGWDVLRIQGCRPLRAAGTLQSLPFRLTTEETLAKTYCVFVPDWTDRAQELHDYVESLGKDMVYAETLQVCCFDLPEVEGEEQLQIAETASRALRELQSSRGAAWSGLNCTAEESARSSFYSMNGSLFFLGILLSLVFLAAAALIIYYKQLSEGYEDRSRFDIMQKVGMTKPEIKRTVNSQVLTVFFAPLLLAGLHLTFAFPFLQKIIRLFGITGTPLLIAASAVCFLVFALLYVFVYRLTARTYYAIVSA